MLLLILEDGAAVENHEDEGAEHEQTATYPLERVAAVEDDPGERTGREVECTAFEAGGNVDGCVLCLGIDIMGGLCEIGGKVGDEIKSDGHEHEADEEGFEHIALCDGETERDHVEHAGE